jgi:hypothetical protein
MCVCTDRKIKALMKFGADVRVEKAVRRSATMGGVVLRKAVSWKPRRWVQSEFGPLIVNIEETFQGKALRITQSHNTPASRKNGGYTSDVIHRWYPMTAAHNLC